MQRTKINVVSMFWLRQERNPASCSPSVISVTCRLGIGNAKRDASVLAEDNCTPSRFLQRLNSFPLYYFQPLTCKRYSRILASCYSMPRLHNFSTASATKLGKITSPCNYSRFHRDICIRIHRDSWIQTKWVKTTILRKDYVQVPSAFIVVISFCCIAQAILPIKAHVSEVHFGLVNA
jgi:hypothetical protein